MEKALYKCTTLLHFFFLTMPHCIQWINYCVASIFSYWISVFVNLYFTWPLKVVHDCSFLAERLIVYCIPGTGGWYLLSTLRSKKHVSLFSFICSKYKLYPEADSETLKGRGMLRHKVGATGPQCSPFGSASDTPHCSQAYDVYIAPFESAF